MKVLIAEDDALTRQGLAEVLRDEGYAVVEAENGEAAIGLFSSEAPDFVCLDVMMPKANGYDVCRRLREIDAKTPIIFISAKSEEIDRIVGLELGADDFINKPFGVKEVVARIRAVTRRCHAANGKEVAKSFTLDDLTVLPAELRAFRDDQPLELSLRDVKILTLLHQHAGEVLDRNTIFNYCWGEDYLPNSRTLDQHISQLRRRIERDPKHPQIIRTVHGAGYRYEPPSDEDA